MGQPDLESTRKRRRNSDPLASIGAANETLLGQAFVDRRERVFLASKFGVMRTFDTGDFTGLDGSAANCRRAIEGSLRRLQTDHPISSICIASIRQRRSRKR